MTKENTKNFGLNQSIADRLDTYLESDFVNFAFLISGEWGTGKTYFIQEYIEHREACQEQIKEQKNRQDSEEYSTHTFCYISLYGVTSFEEIDKLILAQTNMFFSETNKKFGRLAGNFVDTVNFLIPYGEQVSKIKDTITSAISNFCVNIPENLIIIFDDIERSSIDLADTLGYCNKLINENKAKVILLSNESKNLSSEKYQENKEKIIGITMQVVADPSHLYKKCLDNIGRRSPQFVEILEEQKESILNLYEKHEFDNLRTIVQFFYEAEEVLKNLDKTIINHKESCKEILLTLFVLSYLIKQNIISANNIEKIDSYLTSFQNQKTAKYEKIFTKLGISSYAFPKKEWANYFTAGAHFPPINNFYLKKIGVSIPTPLNLRNFYFETSLFFDENLKLMLQEIEERKYTEIPLFFTCV